VPDPGSGKRIFPDPAVYQLRITGIRFFIFAFRPNFFGLMLGTGIYRVGLEYKSKNFKLAVLYIESCFAEFPETFVLY
jgi:hypothetical protein